MAIRQIISPTTTTQAGKGKQEDRYRFLFQNAPISFWEEDMSAIKKYFDDLTANGVEDLSVYFKENPQEAVKCVFMTRIIDVNRATLEMYKADNKPEFLSDVKRVFTTESNHIYTDEIIALAEGKTFFSIEGETIDIEGEKIRILYQYNVLPGHEKDLSRVLVSIIDLTPLRKAEERAKENEEIHRLIYDQAYIGIARISPTGRFMMANKRFCEIMGFTQNELEKMVFFQLVHPSRKSKSVKNWDTLLEGTNTNFSTEDIYQHKNGHPVNVNISVSLIRDISGKPDSYLAVYEDITERKQAEDEIRKFSDAFNNSLDGMVIANKKGIITQFNPAGQKMYGYTEAELIGEDIAKLSPPDIKGQVEEIIDVIKKTKSWQGEVWQLKKDGTRFQIELSTSIIRDSEGKVLGTIGVARDITEKKKAEESLIRNHNLLQAVFEGTSDSIYVKDSLGKYLMINSSGAGYFGMPTDQIIGKKDKDLFDKKFATKIKKIDKEIIDSGKGAVYDTHNVYNGIKNYFSTTKSPFFDHKNNIAGLVGISRNITEKKKAEEHLKTSEEFFRSITENAPIFILKLDREGNIQYINKTGGITDKDAMIGASAYSFVHPSERSIIKEKIKRVFDNKVIEYHEVSAEYNGLRSIFQAKIAPIISDDKVGSVIALVENITEKKEAEDQLNESESRWRSIFEHADDTIITISRDSKIVAINRKFGGVEPEKAVGKIYSELLPKYQREDSEKGIKQVFETGQPFHFEVHFSKEGEKEQYYSAVVAPVVTGGEIELVNAIVRDITHLKKTEGAIMNAMIEGQDNERKRIARELHDSLGQNLSAAKMSLLSLDAQIKRSGLEIRNDLVGRMLDLINEAVEEVRNISHDLMPDLLEQFGIVSALDELSAKSSSELVKITFEPVDMRGRLKANVETGLYRMSQELINNALRHSMAKNIHIQLINHGDSIVLSIEDDGIGFDMKLRTKGIGLKNVESRTKLLNGSMDVESTPGEGTLVTVEIPI